MAIEKFRHNSPVYQVRNDASPTPAIEVEIRHPFIRWRFRNVSYQRNFTGDTDVVVKKLSHGLEIVVQVVPLTGSEIDAYFDLDIELEGGEGILVCTTGAEPSAGGDEHHVIINWEERLDQVV